MKYYFIHIKFKDKSNIYIKNNELFKLSVGNNIINLNYNINKEESSNQNIKIIYDKNFIKKNIGKMIYKKTDNNKITIFNEEFKSNNMKRAKIIIKNKQYDLKGNIQNQKQIFKIKIQFLDNIIKLNSMFRECKSLFSVHNFNNLNTKYLKAIYDLFYGCNSLFYIDDISNWNINNINNISQLFYQCSSLQSLPNISKWKSININDMSFLFCDCSSLNLLPDISKWNLSNTKNISGMFDGCFSLEKLPENGM